MAEAETIGARLKRLRLERDLSQRELAAPGVSYAYISRIEANTRQPSVKALRKLAAKLGVTADYLETGEDCVKACASSSTIDARLAEWGGAELAWDDLTPDERSQVVHGLDDALVDTLVARLHVVRINRELAQQHADA